MTVARAAMLPELLESKASGQIAVIYDEIRRFSGVPYVSSLQRCLATLPGVLEWAWGALRTAMVLEPHLARTEVGGLTTRRKRCRQEDSNLYFLFKL